MNHQQENCLLYNQKGSRMTEKKPEIYCPVSRFIPVLRPNSYQPKEKPDCHKRRIRQHYSMDSEVFSSSFLKEIYGHLLK